MPTVWCTLRYLILACQGVSGSSHCPNLYVAVTPYPIIPVHPYILPGHPILPAGIPLLQPGHPILQPIITYHMWTNTLHTLSCSWEEVLLHFSWAVSIHLFHPLYSKLISSPLHSYSTATEEDGMGRGAGQFIDPYYSVAMGTHTILRGKYWTI